MIASNFWIRAWCLGSIALSVWFLFATVDVSMVAFRSPLFVLLLLLALPATVLLAAILAPLFAFFLFSDIADWQARRNGAPFSIGDRVLIIPGRNSGRQATVTSFGQCQSLRITIDGDDTETGYADHQLKRMA